jgi:prevent-host-death family protein
MARVGATEFKAKCLELMDRVQARRETFVITKRGKPVAKLVPLERGRTAGLFGCMTGKACITGDITAPAIAAESWETVREWDELTAPPAERSTPSKRRKKVRRRTVSR